MMQFFLFLLRSCDFVFALLIYCRTSKPEQNVIMRTHCAIRTLSPAQAHTQLPASVYLLTHSSTGELCVTSRVDEPLPPRYDVLRHMPIYTDEQYKHICTRVHAFEEQCAHIYVLSAACLRTRKSRARVCCKITATRSYTQHPFYINGANIRPRPAFAQRDTCCTFSFEAPCSWYRPSYFLMRAQAEGSDCQVHQSCWPFMFLTRKVFVTRKSDRHNYILAYTRFIAHSRCTLLVRCTAHTDRAHTHWANFFFIMQLWNSDMSVFFNSFLD